MRYLGVLLLIACGGPQTIADACYELGSTYCGVENGCGLLSITEGACRKAFTTGCCSTQNCAGPITNPDGISKCEAALRSESCGQLAGGLLPTICLRDAGR